MRLGLDAGLGPVPPWLLLASVKCRCFEVSPAPSLLRRFHWETGVWQPRAVTLGWVECWGGWSASILPRSPLQPFPGPVCLSSGPAAGMLEPHLLLVPKLQLCICSSLTCPGSCPHGGMDNFSRAVPLAVPTFLSSP